MSLYRRTLFPVLKRFDPESMHDLTLRALSVAQEYRAGQAFLRRIAGQIPFRPVELFGLRFANELGVAAGFDKNAQAVTGISCLGFGHIEVGTLTPRPQAGNRKPRVFRLPEDMALINRMGFPNMGVKQALAGLKNRRSNGNGIVLGISLGMQKETPLDLAADDYVQVMNHVFPYADYLAVNVSSPNTPGLRELQGRTYLSRLLGVLMARNRSLAEDHRRPVCPLLLKISPDLTWRELDSILEAAAEQEISGIVATNTTLSRQGLQSTLRVETGGLSGSPLRERSNEMISYIWRRSGGQMPIVGAGGVMTADDVMAKLDAGASLVQLYSGLVYGGPGVAGQILRRL